MDRHVDPTWTVYLQITPFLSQTYPSLHFVPPGLAWRGSAGAGPAMVRDEAAREASEGRDGARMGRVGVWRASPAGRKAGNGDEEAAQDGGWRRRAELRRRELCTTRQRAG